MSYSDFCCETRGHPRSAKTWFQAMNLLPTSRSINPNIDIVNSGMAKSLAINEIVKPKTATARNPALRLPIVTTHTSLIDRDNLPVNQPTRNVNHLLRLILAGRNLCLQG